MKLPQISMIIGLAVLLNFSIPITWANKKTAIIAGSAGGGAAAVVGDVLLYKLRVGVRYYYDGKLLNVKNNNLDQLVDELKWEDVSETKANTLANDIDEAFNFYKYELGKSFDVYIKSIDNGELMFSIKKGKTYILKDHVAGEELTIPTKTVNTPGNLDNLEEIDGSTTSHSEDSTYSENVEPNTEPTGNPDTTVETAATEADNLETAFNE